MQIRRNYVFAYEHKVVTSNMDTSVDIYAEIMIILGCSDGDVTLMI